MFFFLFFFGVQTPNGILLQTSRVVILSETSRVGWWKLSETIRKHIKKKNKKRHYLDREVIAPPPFLSFPGMFFCFAA